jgi:hypothetical protein
MAVESFPPRGFGRCGLQAIPNADAETLERFLDDHVEPASVPIADCHSSYPAAAKRTYAHRRFVILGAPSRG